MISDVKNYPVSVLFDIDSKVYYTIPRYQREYTWSKYNWEALFDDILECDSAYFLGSIICINQSKDALGLQELELVDGQQRITTLSLLFLALYASLKEFDAEMDDEQRVELINLKNRLVLKKTEQLRVNLQRQNFNQEDYRSLLAQCGLLKNAPKAKNAGNRRIYKCFKYFKDRFALQIQDQAQPLDSLIQLAMKFMQTSLVKIQVESHADAYTLFESLNNRGVPLTPIDIIKNKLLAQLEKSNPESIEENFNHWQSLLDYLGDDYNIQERFFRQYYNGFKPDLAPIIDVPVATKSNLIRIYEKLIHSDAQGFLDRVILTGQYTALILGRCKDEELLEEFQAIHELFQSLERIQSAPSYLLILHLLYYRQEYQLTPAHFGSVLRQLIAFFVRRSVTDTPPTYDLTRLFMAMVDKINTERQADPWGELGQGDTLVAFILQRLAATTASDELFRERLLGPIYEENTWATRFILCSLEESKMTRETWKDLWKYENKLYVWTIEHVFPQGENIPASWVEMMASGDRQEAKNIQEQVVHRLGNLTISGFNSALGNKSFSDKQNREKDGRPVGYKNGLWLNQELAQTEAWSVAQIEARTQKLVDETMKRFQMNPGQV